MASTSSVASSSHPPATQKIFDVFLSFSGETRNNFTAYLLERLEELGITETFVDETNLEKGESVYQLFPAIKQSRFAIIVISPKYGSSKWCMNELVEILKCMEARGAVLPVFYAVEPSDVGHRRGSFGEAFNELEKRFKHDTGMVEVWKHALERVSKIKGWTSKGRVEPELRKEVVEALRSKVRPISLELEEHLVGIDSRLKELDSLLDTESNDVRFIGIWGMSGIGKTTIAKKACERIYDQFDAISFLERVREDFKTRGATYLRRKLSNNLLKRNILDWNDHEGDRLIHFLCRKKVLVILDDVDVLSQLEEFCKKPTCFGPGSRIIITTTNEGLLIAHGVERRFKVEELSDYDALKLFSLKALKRDYPDRSHIEMSKRFVTQANGLPLALKVWGSLVCGRDQAEWSSQLRKLEDGDYNLGGVIDRIKISYGGLDNKEKDNFLDIACFFKGMHKDKVVEILGSGINVLIERSLVTVSDNMVWMHDSLQELGRAIVRAKSQEPGKHSRLWLSEDIFNVLSKNTGTAAVEGIVLDQLESKEEECDGEAFYKMFKLRLLKVHNLLLPEGLKCLPNSLRYLEWKGFPLSDLPPGFEPKEIVELSLCHSSLEQLWDGTKNFDNLKVIKLSHSKNLRRTNFEGVQNLEILDLEGCESLVDIDSIGVLEKLKFLNLKDCKSLESLPEEIEMEFLEILILAGCLSVKKVPEFVGPMKSLWKICLDGTAIENIPSSVEGLTSLSLLEMRDCVYLKSLPSNIGNFKSLEHLHVSGCSKLEKLPESIGKLEFIKEIDASGTGIIELPSSFADLKNLASFSFHGPKRPSLQPGSISVPISSFFTPLQQLRSLAALNLSDLNLGEGAIPSDIRFSPSLVYLDLSGNDFCNLPRSISKLSKLESLCLSRCTSLKHLPALSSDANLQVTADECTALETLQYPSNLDRLNTSYFNFINSFGMLDNETYDCITFDMLQGYLSRAVRPGERYEVVIRGKGIPRWFIHQRLGASLSVDVNWHNNNKWMGYAACAVFEVFDVGWEIFCVLEIDGQEEGTPPLLSSNVLPVSDHLWLFYVSRDISFGTQRQKSRNQLKFSFQSSDSCLVKWCGVRLVYEQDVMTQPSYPITCPYYQTFESEEEFDEIVYPSSSTSSTTSRNEAVDDVQEFNHTMTTTSSCSNDSLYNIADDAEGSDQIVSQCSSSLNETLHDAEDFNPTLSHSQFSRSSPWAHFMGWIKSCLGLI